MTVDTLITPIMKKFLSGCPHPEIAQEVYLKLHAESNNDSRILELLLFSVGRITIEKSDRVHEVTRFLKEDVVRQMRDWLVDSMAKNEEWLSLVNGEGIPKKLLAPTTVRELVDALVSTREISLNSHDPDPPKDDGYKRLSLNNENFLLFRIVSEDAIKAESDIFNIDLYQVTSVATFAAKDGGLYLVTDLKGNSLAVFSVGGGRILSINGRFEAMPSDLVVRAINAFGKDNSFKLIVEPRQTGYVSDVYSNWHRVDRLPDGLDVHQLDLNGLDDLLSLPSGLRVRGTLRMGNSNITQIPGDAHIDEIDVGYKRLSLPPNLDASTKLWDLDEYLTPKEYTKRHGRGRETTGNEPKIKSFLNSIIKSW